MVLRLKLRIWMVAIDVQTCASHHAPLHSFDVNLVVCDLSHEVPANYSHVVAADDCKAVVDGQDIGKKGSLRERYVESAAPQILVFVVNRHFALRSPRPSR